MEEFYDVQIDEELETVKDEQKKPYKNSFAGQKIIELKTNFIPKGRVPLERIFDNNDVFLKPKSKTDRDTTVDCNIGTESEPKYANVSKYLPEETKNKYKSLLQQYAYIFAWSYSDLKTYDKGVMEHKTPLKTYAKPII